MKQINVKPIWSVLCQEASVDANTNNISLFKVVEQLQFGLKMEELDKLKDNPKFDPAKPITFPFASQLVILWKNLSNTPVFEFPVKILLIDPNGKIIDEMFSDFRFEEGKDRLRTIVSINMIPVTKSGDYTYSVMTKQNKNDDFEEVCSVPMRIDLDLRRDGK